MASLKGFNGRLAFTIIAVALGSSFQHGYNTGVLKAPQRLIEDWITTVEFNRTGQEVEQSKVTMIWSIAVAIFYVGGMLGGCITDLVAERFGRKGGLLLNNILVAGAAIFMGSAKAAASYEMLIVGRFLIGINAGLNAGLALMYLAEISPIHLRGAVRTVYQLVIFISYLISQILGLESVLGTEKAWPALLAITAIPAVFQLATLPVCPESPKYILKNQDNEHEAQRALTLLRGTNEVHDEMDEMKSGVVPKVTVREMFFNPALCIPLIISIMLMIVQNLVVINAEVSVLWVSSVAILSVILSVAMFITGPGSILRFLVSELFIQSSIPAGTSFAVAVNWTANFVVVLALLPLQEPMGGYAFIIFSIFLVFFVLFVWMKVPETKNKTMEEISATFLKDNTSEEALSGGH